MNFDHRHYVPCLRWKQGEYQAVWRLPYATKSVVIPIIEVPEIGYDFENETAAKTIDEHLSPFAERVYKKWGDSPCFVDVNLVTDKQMVDGTHPVHFIFEKLRMMKCSVIPVTGLLKDKEYQQEIKATLAKDKNGICLRITIEQAAKSTFKAEVDSLLSTLEIQPTGCDFVLDLGAPNFVPLEGFVKIIKDIVTKLSYLNNWRTFTLLGTSFPESMGSIKEGVGIVPRHEWQLYKMLVADFKKAKLRLPAFGDYAINHPKVLELDMRIVKPSATIRYTVDDNWYIAKGKNVRDEKFGKYTQYHELSRRVVASRYYCGTTFSWGDNFIQQCANGGNTSSLMMWRQVGTNHHIEKVIWDIASFYAS
jgi:hypothetical protein